MERVVRDSDLDWTLLRAARLTNGPRTGTYRVAYDTKLAGAWSISRADVAHFLLTRLADPAASRRVAEMAY
jgi:putative NADH-flavin reductase